MQGKVKKYLWKACDFFFLQGASISLRLPTHGLLFSDCGVTDRMDGGLWLTGIRLIRLLILWCDRFLGPRILRIGRKALRKALGRFQKVFRRFQKPLRRFRKAPGHRTATAERACRRRGTVEPRARNARAACATRRLSRTWEWPNTFVERTSLIPVATNGLHTVLPDRRDRLPRRTVGVWRRCAVRQMASINLQMASRSALSSSRNFSTLYRASLRSE